MNNCPANDFGAALPLFRTFELCRGDTWALTVRVTHDGVPFIMNENSRVTFAMKHGSGPVFSKTFTASAQDGDTGDTLISLSPAESELLEPGAYVYEIEFMFSPDNVVTVLHGQLTVHEDLITAELRGE